MEETRRQLQNLSSKIGVSPVSSSKKVGNIPQDSRAKTEDYKQAMYDISFQMWSLRHGLQVGFTSRHLYQRIIKLACSRSSIGNNMESTNQLLRTVTKHYCVTWKVRVYANLI